MPASTDQERQVKLIVDNAHWLQAIICEGCTNRFHSHGDIIDGRLVLSDPECLSPDCAGHEPVAAYLGALQALRCVPTLNASIRLRPNSY